MSDSAPRRVGRAGGGDTRRRRRLILLAVLGPVGAVTAAALLSEPRSSAPDAGPAVDQAPGSVLAYLVATGIFAQPPAEQRPEAFAAAEVAAAEAGAPLAFTVWTEREAFDTLAWRDLIQVGRVPAYPPPAIDFMREVAVLVWPAAGPATAALRRAPGLVVRGAVLRHTAVEIRLGPGPAGQVPATPRPGGDVLPYALVTVPRNQWPVPAPPPTVPPLSVALAT